MGIFEDANQLAWLKEQMKRHRVVEKELKKHRDFITYDDDEVPNLVDEKYKLEMKFLSWIPRTFFKQITEPLTQKP